MDLEELRAFLSVVETGSFLGAERALRMPRATVRRRVEALEARAGVPLLDRTPQGITATEAGSVLVTRGRQMIQEASALVASVRELGREPSGVLRVLLPQGLPPHALVPLFGMLRDAYPKLTVHARMSHDPVSGLLDDVDLAVHFGERSPPGPWVSYEVLRLREHLVAHSAYLAVRGTPTTLHDLHAHELFAWEMPAEDARVLPLWSGGTLPIEPALVTSDIHLLRQVMLAQRGIALLPDAELPDPNTEPGDVVTVLRDVVGRERALRVVVPSVLAEVPKVKAVLRHVRAWADAAT